MTLDASQEALPDDPSLAPVFWEPWEARAFALTLTLHRQGVFTWAEWTAALSKRLHGPGVAADGEDYHHLWFAALEDCLEARGLAPPHVHPPHNLPPGARP